MKKQTLVKMLLEAQEERAFWLAAGRPDRAASYAALIADLRGLLGFPSAGILADLAARYGYTKEQP